MRGHTLLLHRPALYPACAITSTSCPRTLSAKRTLDHKMALHRIAIVLLCSHSFWGPRTIWYVHQPHSSGIQQQRTRSCFLKQSPCDQLLDFLLRRTSDTGHKLLSQIFSHKSKLHDAPGVPICSRRFRRCNNKPVVVEVR